MVRCGAVRACGDWVADLEHDNFRSLLQESVGHSLGIIVSCSECFMHHIVTVV